MFNNKEKQEKGTTVCLCVFSLVGLCLVSVQKTFSIYAFCCRYSACSLCLYLLTLLCLAVLLYPGQA